jgi:hypothetical protein
MAGTGSRQRSYQQQPELTWGPHVAQVASFDGAPLTLRGSVMSLGSEPIFAQLGSQDGEYAFPWERPQSAHDRWIEDAGRKSAALGTVESPAETLKNSSSDLRSAATGRMPRWTEDWDPLEDVLSLLAEDWPNRLAQGEAAPQAVLFGG